MAPLPAPPLHSSLPPASKDEPKSATEISDQNCFANVTLQTFKTSETDLTEEQRELIAANRKKAIAKKRAAVSDATGADSNEMTVANITLQSLATFGTDLTEEQRVQIAANRKRAIAKRRATANDETGGYESLDSVFNRRDMAAIDRQVASVANATSLPQEKLGQTLCQKPIAITVAKGSNGGEDECANEFGFAQQEESDLDNFEFEDFE